MGARADLLRAIQAGPDDHTAWLALADCLEEEGEPDRAELLRLDLELRHTAPRRRKRETERRLQELLRAGVRPCVPTRKTRTGLVLALVPAGRYLRGGTTADPGHFSDESPRHEVTISRPFYLGVTQVTQKQWQALMGNNPSRFPGDDRPVERVRWEDAVQFCEALGGKERRTVRLPTEAEWEYACRAGSSTHFNTGDGVEAMRAAGWCSYDDRWGSAKRTVSVGQYAPNAWGLYDMHGNVYEWCMDFKDQYRRTAQTDPMGQQQRVGRALRGGSWHDVPRTCRSAFRLAGGPGNPDGGVGLRVWMEWR